MQALEHNYPRCSLQRLDPSSGFHDTPPVSVLQSATSKAGTLVWYLRHPKYYRELVRKVLNSQLTTRKTVARAQAEKSAGQAWCEAQKQDKSSILTAIGINEPLLSLATHQPELYQAAETAWKNCPVELGGAAELDLLYTIITHLQPKNVLETGVAAGWSTLAILAALPSDGRLQSVDMPYAKRNNEDYVGCVVPDTLRGSWTLHRVPDRDGIPMALESQPTLDLVHYDSDKSYAGRMFAHRKLWPHVASGGLFMSDDIEDNDAFRDFAAEVGAEPYVVAKLVPNNYAGILRKP